MSDPPVFVGIDVSKAQLDVALRPTDDCWHVNTDELGIAGLVECLRPVQPTLVVLQATGGLEVLVTGALAEAGLPVVVVHPRHAREFAQATGRLAKTDTFDARGLAHVAAAIHSSPLWRAKDEILQSRPGVGPILARTLVAEVPELEVLNRQEIAALIGVAPFNREGGTLRGKRAVWGGRAHVCAVLYMSALAAMRHHPVLKAFYEPLRAVGKALKSHSRRVCKLLTMLHAMLKHRTPWQENYAHHT